MSLFYSSKQLNDCGFEAFRGSIGGDDGYMVLETNGALMSEKLGKSLKHSLLKIYQ